MRSCPDRQRTYADAAREGAGQRQRQEPAEEAGLDGEPVRREILYLPVEQGFSECGV